MLSLILILSIMADKDHQAPSSSVNETPTPPQTTPTPPQSAKQRLQHFMLSLAQSQESRVEERKQRTAEITKQRKDQATFQPQMLAIMQKTTQPIQVVMTPKENDPNETSKKFKKRNPLEFNGSGDLMGANEFITQMERIFDVFQSTKKESATYNLNFSRIS